MFRSDQHIKVKERLTGLGRALPFTQIIPIMVRSVFSYGLVYIKDIAPMAKGKQLFSLSFSFSFSFSFSYTNILTTAANCIQERPISPVNEIKRLDKIGH